MNRSSEYDRIEGVSLHFIDGSSVYMSNELMRLNNDLTLGVSLEFAVVNFTNGASPEIITKAQELYKFLGLNFDHKC